MKYQAKHDVRRIKVEGFLTGFRTLVMMRDAGALARRTITTLCRLGPLPVNPALPINPLPVFNFFGEFMSS